MSTEIERDRAENDVERAVAALGAGEPVLVHDFDDREGETDLVYPAGAVEHGDVARLRNDAGGLVCVALGHDEAIELDLPFVRDVLDHPAAGVQNLRYDDRSSFSLTVNHRETHTGITDVDRALTISRLGRVAADPGRFDFADEFRAPGHVHLLRGAEDLLADRQGHTELCLSLADAADCPPAVVVCEMLDDHSGRSLSKERAREYGRRHDIPFVRGEQIVGTLR